MANSSNSNSDTNPKDFGDIVTELSLCIEIAVESLYKYQATDRNAGLTGVRSTLQQQWKDILQYLRACQAFRADIVLLKDYLEGDKDDRTEFLKEMVEGTGKLKVESENLKKRSRKVQQEFTKKTLGRNNLEANNALSSIQSKLELIEIFWKSKEDEARKAGNNIFTPENVSEIIEDWKERRTNIQEAIRDISRATDAIPIIPPRMPPNQIPFFKRLMNHLVYFEPPEFEKALESFMNAPKKRPNLDFIAKCAEESLQFFKFWTQVQSKNQVVLIIVKGIREQSIPYVNAIDQSVKVAVQGCTFSADAVGFCNSLLDPDITKEQLAEYASEMRNLSREVVQAATTSLNLFRDIRTALFKIIAEMNKAVAGTGSQGSGFQHLYPSLVSGSYQTEFLDSVADPEKTLEGLQNLIINVDQFTDWWVEMEIALNSIKDWAEVRSSGSRLRDVKKSWVEIHDDYMNYKTKIYTVRDQTGAIEKVMGLRREFEKALDKFLSASEVHPDLNVIATGIEESWEFIKSWIHIQSENPVVLDFVNGVQGQTDQYIAAIDRMVEMSEQGCIFSVDAIDFCNVLLDSNSKPEELREYISEMHHTASVATKTATEALNLFRDIRIALFRIASGMDAAAAGTESQGFGSKHSNQLILAAFSSQLKSIVDPKKALQCLQTLTRNVDGLVNWWADMEAVLKAIQEKAKAGISRLRSKNAKERWEKVKEEYKTYKRKTCAVRDQTQDIKASSRFATPL